MPSVWSARLLRAAGRNLHFDGFVSGLLTWRKARTTAKREVAINRLTKLRFPQGSEVSINGCPSYATAEKSGRTNPEPKAEIVQPEPRRWRAVSAFPRSWSRALS